MLESMPPPPHWYFGIDACNIPSQLIPQNGVIWFQCPWSNNVGSLIEHFLLNSAKRVCSGTYLCVGLLLKRPYFNSYSLETIIERNYECVNNSTSVLKSCDYLGADDQLVKGVLNFGYRHRGRRYLHPHVFEYHITLVFRKKYHHASTSTLPQKMYANFSVYKNEPNSPDLWSTDIRPLNREIWPDSIQAPYPTFTIPFLTSQTLPPINHLLHGTTVQSQPPVFPQSQSMPAQPRHTAPGPINTQHWPTSPQPRPTSAASMLPQPRPTSAASTPPQPRPTSAASTPPQPRPTSAASTPPQPRPTSAASTSTQPLPTSAASTTPQRRPTSAASTAPQPRPTSAASTPPQPRPTSAASTSTQPLATSAASTAPQPRPTSAASTPPQPRPTSAASTSTQHRPTSAASTSTQPRPTSAAPKSPQPRPTVPMHPQPRLTKWSPQSSQLVKCPSPPTYASVASKPVNSLSQQMSPQTRPDSSQSRPSTPISAQSRAAATKSPETK